MMTTMLGALSNILFNLLLIPRIGIQGAAIATFISYLVVYLARALDIKKLYRFRDSFGIVMLNMLLLIAESLFLLYFRGNFYIPGTIVMVLLLVVNAPQILQIMVQFWGMFKRKLLHR